MPGTTPPAKRPQPKGPANVREPSNVRPPSKPTPEEPPRREATGETTEEA